MAVQQVNQYLTYTSTSSPAARQTFRQGKTTVSTPPSRNQNTSLGPHWSRVRRSGRQDLPREGKAVRACCMCQRMKIGIRGQRRTWRRRPSGWLRSSRPMRMCRRYRRNPWEVSQASNAGKGIQFFDVTRVLSRYSLPSFWWPLPRSFPPVAYSRSLQGSSVIT
jgi:hypothetical protein